MTGGAQELARRLHPPLSLQFWFCLSAGSSEEEEARAKPLDRNPSRQSPGRGGGSVTPVHWMAASCQTQYIRDMRFQARCTMAQNMHSVFGHSVRTGVYQRHIQQECRDSGNEGSRMRPGLAVALLMHFFRDAQNTSGGCAAQVGVPRHKTPVLIIKL